MTRTTARYMKSTGKGRFPEHILAVDVESNIEINPDGSQRHTFRLGSAIHLHYDHNKVYEKHYDLWSVEDWWNLLDKLTKHKRHLYIFAHNSAYDYPLLKMDSYFSDRNHTFKWFVINRPFIVRTELPMENGKFSCTFTDTTNWFPKSLKALGKVFGIEKMDSPDFHNDDDETVMTYCRQDTTVLAEIIKRYIEYIKSNNLGGIRFTIASQAMSAFQSGFLQPKTVLIHNNQEILDLEMMSYRGGRTESFYLGEKENVYKVDVNSMYPFVMYNNPYPVKPLSRKPVRGTVDDMIEMMVRGHHVLATVDLEMHNPAIGFAREKLIFPTGHFTTTLTNPELQHILENSDDGRITDVRQMVAYETDYLFSDYIDFFYGEKLDGNRTGNIEKGEMSKLFLNSLYGKFGQLKNGEICQLDMDSPKVRTTVQIMRDLKTRLLNVAGTMPVQQFILLGDQLYLLKPAEKKEPSSQSCPIISSTVTGYARMYLWELMKVAGTVYYCDTDSLVTDETGFHRLLNAGYMDETRLGALKLEEYGKILVRGSKNYVFHDERTGKTIEKYKGIKLKSADTIRNADGSFEQSQWVTKKCRYQSLADDGEIRIKRIIKHNRSQYDKGYVHSNGTVSPWHLMETRSD